MAQETFSFDKKPFSATTPALGQLILKRGLVAVEGLNRTMCRTTNTATKEFLMFFLAFGFWLLAGIRTWNLGQPTILVVYDRNQVLVSGTETNVQLRYRYRNRNFSFLSETETFFSKKFKKIQIFVMFSHFLG